MKQFLRCSAALLAYVLCIAPSMLAGNKVAFNAPAISCAAGGSGATVNVMVTGGASGAPAGFSIHWILRSEYDQHGWSGGGTSYCEASFSGNANGHYYSLDPGESVTIPIGEPFTIAGASGRCDGVALKCGETYAFRVFAHATSNNNRSAWSDTTYCSTMACAGDDDDDDDDGEEAGCTLTTDFWASSGPSTETQVWPVTGLTLGNVFYTDVQLELILNTPSTGSDLLALAHELITAKLNVAAGATGGGINAKIAAADAVVGNLVVQPIGSGRLSKKVNAAVHITALKDFNQGVTGPGSCE